MENDTWNSLSRFQTHDLVRRAFERRHERELNATRTWEITSCFIQAREYFASAGSAAEAVRPLLLYYGVLSLSRGMILFLKPGATEESLKPSHGLRTSDWNAVFTRKPLNVLELEVIVEAGTFADLASVTAAPTSRLFPTPDGSLDLLAILSPSHLEPAHSIKFDDLLARIPRLWLAYEEVTERRAMVRLGSILRTPNQLAVRLLRDPVAGVINADEVRNLFKVPASVPIGAMPPNAGFEMPHLVYGLSRANQEALPLECPAIEDMNGDMMGHLIVPWPNGIDVPAILKCYLASYFLGMLVRYFPSRWMGLIHGHKGDAALPLLHAAMAYVEHDFPKLALEIL